MRLALKVVIENDEEFFGCNSAIEQLITINSFCLKADFMKLIGPWGQKICNFTIDVFRYATPCRLINIWWCFEVTYCFLLPRETDKVGFDCRSET